ncbi:MAG: DUF2306 domain-containing protein [Asticcacaulis sp.]
MNLDLLPLGWLHSLACLVALAAGAYGFSTRKGSPHHILTGRVYMVAMLILNLSALGIYRLGVFFFPHVLAVITLVLIAVGWLSARSHWPRPLWRYIHLSCMIGSYYMLIGGGVNEVFLRVYAIRELLNSQGEVMLALTHGSLMLVFLILLIGWNGVEIARGIARRRKANANA